MILADVLAASKTHTFDIFPPTTVSMVEKRMEMRNDKPFIRCLVRDKWFAAKPEEIVRQLWLEHLHRRYGYPINRLAVEVPVTFGYFEQLHLSGRSRRSAECIASFLPNRH